MWNVSIYSPKLVFLCNDAEYLNLSIKLKEISNIYDPLG
jgi:hypothetical protein